jgi:hypothetical protein
MSAGLLGRAEKRAGSASSEFLGPPLTEQIRKASKGNRMALEATRRNLPRMNQHDSLQKAIRYLLLFKNSEINLIYDNQDPKRSRCQVEFAGKGYKTSG